MKTFFSPNLTTKGRIVRALGAATLLIGAGYAFPVSAWLGLILTASGAFVLFEALSGWCLLRACGVKTRL